jgi:hypothetical protein
MPDGSWLQYLHLQKAGALIPVEEARHTRGAILFSFSSQPHPGGARPSHAHVAISDGDGGTIEARGRAYGVGNFASKGRFNYAAVIPGLGGGKHGAGGTGGTHGAEGTAVASTDPGEPVASGAAIEGGFAPVSVIDTDSDGLPDDLEARLHTDPYSSDTDGDGVRDSLEIIYTHTDPLAADPREALDAALDGALAQVLGEDGAAPDGPVPGSPEHGSPGHDGTGHDGAGADGSIGDGTDGVHATGQPWAREVWAEPSHDPAHDSGHDSGHGPTDDPLHDPSHDPLHDPGHDSSHDPAYGGGWESGSGWESGGSGHHA